MVVVPDSVRGDDSITLGRFARMIMESTRLRGSARCRDGDIGNNINDKLVTRIAEMFREFREGCC